MMNITVCETFCPTEEKIADYPSLVWVNFGEK
jgi:hypothetical protein